MIYHSGELAVQARAGVQEEAEALGKSIGSIIKPAAKEFLHSQQLAIASTIEANGRVWASLLMGEPGFMQGVAEQRVRITINYARVSSHDQKDDLTRQAQVLEAFSATNGWQYETIQDLGSGLNYNKKGLQKLLKRIMQGDVGRLVLTHKDRLLRFGSELVFAMCEEFETEVVIINKSSEELSFEQELVTDMIELITVFSARLYGSRSKKNKKLIDGMTQVVKEVS